MRSYHRSIILCSLLMSGSAHALDFSLEALEWRASLTDDWSYQNSLTVPNQIIAYNTLDYKFRPGYRAGVTYGTNWDAVLYYTHYFTQVSASATGNVLPAYMGSTTAKPKDLFDPSYAYFYQSGQVNSAITYNIFDLLFGKKVNLTDTIMVHPFAGFMGGWIDQTIHAQFQGTTSTIETVTDNYTSIGPKVGIDASGRVLNYHDVQVSLTAMFASSFLLGHWAFNDHTRVTPAREVVVITPSKNMGTITLQSMLGIKMDYQKFSLKLAYEIGDWFNADQIFDNDSGTHSNDLILQGATLGLTYSF